VIWRWRSAAALVGSAWFLNLCRSRVGQGRAAGEDAADTGVTPLSGARSRTGLARGFPHPVRPCSCERAPGEAVGDSQF
jgi:hypothetical protein